MSTVPSVGATPHVAYIDSLRGIAVASVIAVHISGVLKVPGPLGSALTFGAKDVQLFYIVSALTLMMSMTKRAGSEPRPLLSFLLRRFFRIAPAFYLVLLVYCLLGWLSNSAFTGIRAPLIPPDSSCSFIYEWVAS